MSAATTLEEVESRIRSLVDEALKPPMLVEARAWANEVDVVGARRSQEAALDAHRSAQASYRSAQGVEAEVQAAYDAVVSEIEWFLGDSFATEGNKTFLVIANGEQEPIKRQMTADERKAWIAKEALRNERVVKAARNLRGAKESTLAARDELSHADLRVSASKHDLDSRIAELNLLAAAMPRKVTI